MSTLFPYPCPPAWCLLCSHNPFTSCCNQSYCPPYVLQVCLCCYHAIVCHYLTPIAPFSFVFIHRCHILSVSLLPCWYIIFHCCCTGFYHLTYCWLASQFISVLVHIFCLLHTILPFKRVLFSITLLGF
jgi:hypothetical protein